MQIFKYTPLNSTEEDQIIAILSQPLVKRYLTQLALNVAQDLCMGAPDQTESDTLYMRKEMVSKGQLALLETLLAIQAPSTKQ